MLLFIKKKTLRRHCTTVTRRKSRDEIETAGYETRHETVPSSLSQDQNSQDEMRCKTKYIRSKISPKILTQI